MSTEIGQITEAISSVQKGRLPRSLRVFFHRSREVQQVRLGCLRTRPDFPTLFTLLTLTIISPKKESVWATMSMELLTNVARFLTTEEQRAMHLVCKQWQHAVQEACGHLVVKKWNARRLGLFQGLRELTLSDLTITASTVRELGAFRKLTGLNLINCSVDKDANVLGLPHELNGLTSLTLKHVRGVSELHLELLIGMSFCRHHNCVCRPLCVAHKPCTKISHDTGELPLLRRLHLHTATPKRPSEYDEPDTTPPTCPMPGLTVLSLMTDLQALELHSGTPRASLLPGLRHLSALGALRHLHLVGVGVDNEVFNACPLLPRLQHLALPNATDLTDPGMLCLNPCTQLTYLDVGCSPTGNGSSLITNASALYVGFVLLE